MDLSLWQVRKFIAAYRNEEVVCLSAPGRP